jgi:hypothetical protein
MITTPETGLKSRARFSIKADADGGNIADAASRSTATNNERGRNGMCGISLG